MTGKIKTFKTKLIAWIAFFCMLIGILPSAAYAQDKNPVHLEPNQIYTVIINANDTVGELYGYIFNKALVRTDGEARPTVEFIVWKKWNGNKISEFGFYRNPEDSSSALVNMNIVPASGSIKTGEFVVKDLAGTIPVEGLDISVANYKGHYKLQNADANDDFDMVIDWNSLEEGNSTGYEAAQTEDKTENPKKTDGIFFDSEFKINAGEEYDTLILHTKSQDFYDGTRDIRNPETGDTVQKILATSEFYMDLTQESDSGTVLEHCVWNGGIGGFIVPYDTKNQTGKVIISIPKGKFSYDRTVSLRIVELGKKDHYLELDLSGNSGVIKSQIQMDPAEAEDSGIIELSEMKNGQTYTGSFKAVRSDDDSRESMLAGFFDKNVKLEISPEGKVTATFYNTVFAHSMLDFGFMAADGTWTFTALNGYKTPEYIENGSDVVAAGYTLPIPDPRKEAVMVAGVNVMAMGGAVENNGDDSQYTKVKILFDKQVTKGFKDFESKANRLSQAKLINRALMRYTGLDANADGVITKAEMQSYRFPAELDFSRDAMFTSYNIHDNFDLSDLSWLNLIANPEDIRSMNFNDMRIGAIGDEFKRFSNLESLNLSANVITQIKDFAFEQSGKLTKLRLSKNMLTVIGVNAFKGLTNLQGDNTTDDGDGFNQNFSLSDNQIKAIETGAFDDMQGITSFDFNENVFESFDAGIFSKNPERIKSLTVENNKLNDIPVQLSRLSGLTFLGLSYNQISAIGGRLDNLPSIRSIYLISNYISEIPDSVIKSNKRLRELKIDKNSVISIPISMLERMAEGETGFNSIYAYNALDITKMNLNSLNPEQRAALEKNLLRFPSKAFFNPLVTAQNGKITFKLAISGLDYYIWARTKGYVKDSTISAIVETIFGEGNSIDTVEQLLTFRQNNLPSLSEEDVKKSILTNVAGAVDAVKLKTQIQKYSGVSWFTKAEWEDKQDAGTLRGLLEGEFTDEYAVDQGLYRILITAKSSVESGRSQEYAFYFRNAGDADATNSEIPNSEAPRSELPKSEVPDSAVPDKGVSEGVRTDSKTVDSEAFMAALAKGKLEDGKYTVNVRMKKAADPKRKEYSMADRSANKTVLLEVINGQTYVRTAFKGMNVEVSEGKSLFGYLGNLQYYKKGYDYNTAGIPQGEKAEAEVITVHMENNQVLFDKYNQGQSGYPNEVRFPIVDLKRAYRDTYIPLHVFVPIMESIAKNTGEQDVLMQFEWNSIRKIDVATALNEIKQVEPFNNGLSGESSLSNGEGLSGLKPGVTVSADGISKQGQELPDKSVDSGKLNSLPGLSAGKTSLHAGGTGLSSPVKATDGALTGLGLNNGNRLNSPTENLNTGFGLSGLSDDKIESAAGGLEDLKLQDSGVSGTNSVIAPKKIGPKAAFWSAIAAYLLSGGGILLYKRRKIHF